MVRSQLNSYSGSDPIWGFVALIGSERFTGEAAVGLDPRVRLFAVDGRVYFAEREGDAPISTRLVNCGAVTTTQLEHGSVRIGEVASLARLFQREPSIDRDAVELTIETATESLLESIANKAVGMPEVFPLRHHASGIHHWLRAAATTQAPLALPTVEATVAAEPAVTAEPVAEPSVAEPSVVEQFVAPVAEPVTEPFVAPVVETVMDTPVVEEPADIAPVLPTISWPTSITANEAAAPEPVVEAALVAAEPELVAEPEVVADPAPMIEPVVEPVVEVAEPVVAHVDEEPLWQPTWQPRVPTLTSLEPEPEPTAPEAAFDPFKVVEEPAVEEPAAEEPAAAEPVASLPTLTPWAPAPVAETPTEQLPTLAPEADVEETPEPTTHESPTTSTFAPLPMLGSLNGTSHEAPAEEPLAPLASLTPLTPLAAVEPEEPAVAPSLPAMPTLGSLTSLPTLNGHHSDDTVNGTSNGTTNGMSHELTNGMSHDVADAPPSLSSADLLGSLDSLTAPTPAHEVNPYEPGDLPSGLPKLASAPISMDDIGTNAAPETGPWGGPAHNHAAVGIWEMVDELLDDGKPVEQDLVGSGGGEKRGRGWLRGKKS